MIINSITFTNDGVQITYIEDHNVDSSGIVVASVMDCPHAYLPNDLMDDLVDSVRAIVDNGLVTMRRPPTTIEPTGGPVPYSQLGSRDAAL